MDMCSQLRATVGIAPHVTRHLAAFDFDYTVVAQNTDTVIRDMLPAHMLPSDSLVEIAGWTEYMAEVFRRLHKIKVTPAQIREKIRFIPEVPGLVRLLKQLHNDNNFDLIIISDSNSVFIAEWLEMHKLSNCFARVFTNPARFDESGLLQIQPYHYQTECKLSAANLCKGKVLEHFVINQDLRHNIEYDRVVYVGDGGNDLCPMLKLRSNDIGCVRGGFALERKILMGREKMQLRAHLVVWKNGFDLLATLTELLQLRESNKKKLLKKLQERKVKTKQTARKTSTDENEQSAAVKDKEDVQDEIEVKNEMQVTEEQEMQVEMEMKHETEVKDATEVKLAAEMKHETEVKLATEMKHEPEMKDATQVKLTTEMKHEPEVKLAAEMTAEPAEKAPTDAKQN